MIRPPRRSVTRFFIPMIDVLTLLFCMFLLMPIFRENETLSQQEEPSHPAQLSDVERELERRKQELREMNSEQQRAKEQLAYLEKRNRDFLQKNLRVIVLDISPRDGTLSYFDPKDPAKPPVKISSEAQARQLIAEQKKEAGPLELFFVFQRPHDPAIKFPYYPTDVQTERYGRWFYGVACGGFVTQLPEAKEKHP